MRIDAPKASPGDQRGYTLIELSVAILIGLFLLGGVLTLVQNNRRAFGSQNMLAQLQDNERLAMTMISDVIQAAGYFPNPAIYSAASFNATPQFATAGQTIAGTSNAAAPGDTIAVRYMTIAGDNIINCSGKSNTDAAGTTHVYGNAFSVDAATGQLMCTLSIDGVAQAPIALVGGVQGIQNFKVQQLTVLYGVATSGTSNNVDTYMTAAQVNASGNWSNVTTVLVTLTFNNPLYAAGQGQPQTIAFQRVVGVMNRFGVKI